MEYRQLERRLEKSKGEIQRWSQNYCIQGSAASMSKLAGVFFLSEVLKRDMFGVVKLINMVHDRRTCRG